MMPKRKKGVPQLIYGHRMIQNKVPVNLNGRPGTIKFYLNDKFGCTYPSRNGCGTRWYCPKGTPFTTKKLTGLYDGI